MESVKKYPFLLFFQKNADVSILLSFKANYLEKMQGYPRFSLWISSTSSFKDLLLLRGPNLAQKPLYLVGTALKLQTEKGQTICRKPQCKVTKHISAKISNF